MCSVSNLNRHRRPAGSFFSRIIGESHSQIKYSQKLMSGCGLLVVGGRLMPTLP